MSYQVYNQSLEIYSFCNIQDSICMIVSPLASVYTNFSKTLFSNVESYHINKWCKKRKEKEETPLGKILIFKTKF